MVAAVWLLGIFFFIVPAFQELGEKREELDNKQVELSKLNDSIEKDKDLPKRIEDAYAQSEELSKNFYEYTSTQTATDTVDNLLDEAKVTNSKMSIGEYSITTIKPFYYVSTIKFSDFDKKADQYEGVGDSSNDSAASTSSAAEVKQIQEENGNVIVIDPNQGIPIGSYSISLDFTGKFGDVQTFCENLYKNMPKSMVISSLSVSDVTGKTVLDKQAKEEAAKDGSSEAPKPESSSKSDKEGVEAYDDQPIEGTIEINLMVIKKLSKPE
ncbi:hypothetical protein [Ruminococcus sp. FC2018]|uniref:hypothetical protein n=1 Tax=Ruminococcus sp. FC2018 TaxID=1410617 RepID=UPI00048C6EE0|nr:hypothetical protein [Ruminococcus sp. FC2018]